MNASVTLLHPSASQPVACPLPCAGTAVVSARASDGSKGREPGGGDFGSRQTRASAVCSGAAGIRSSGRDAPDIRDQQGQCQQHQGERRTPKQEKKTAADDDRHWLDRQTDTRAGDDAPEDAEAIVMGGDGWSAVILMLILTCTVGWR